MLRKLLLAPVLICVVAIAISCGKQSSNPVSPESATPTTSGAAGDSTELKATAPTPQSPINGAKPTDPVVTLVIGNSTTPYASGVPLVYRFEIYDAGGNRVYQSQQVPGGSGGATRHEISTLLEGDKTYQWQARAEYLGVAGPWSARASFIAPATTGYIRGGELYDPLINGRTVGTPVGAVEFIPGVGVKILNHASHVRYILGATVAQGEYSLLVTNMPANTKGDKTKVFSMSEGDADIVTNARRATFEKRGDPPGIIAWRFITSADQIDTIGGERVFYNFQASETYFWKATWGNNQFNLLIKEGGADGRTVYDNGKEYAGVYNPNPHFAWLGAPVGRSGDTGASVNDMIIRQVWLSNRPRPAFANK